MATDCIFCKILSGERAASFVYRDEYCAAFMDIRPVNPGHLLVVPTAHAAGLSELDAPAAGYLMEVGHRLIDPLRRSGVRCEGVNLFLAEGEAAGQEVFHVHLHVLPRYRGDGFGMPLGPQTRQAPGRAALDEVAGHIREGLSSDS